ncbi:MAG TPA: hypothetical protein VFN73_14410 [Propionibacteriaceae bacterium]|nr:hypothetical protein [Propionibacteriaceae bacterium]
MSVEQGLPEPPPLAEPPQTGNQVIDSALRELADLSEQPVGLHHDRLQAVQEVLSQVLATSRDAVQSPIPGVPGPRVR